MVKYGKEFRKNQKSDWKDKYFNYKAQKQLIKKYIKNKEDPSSEGEEHVIEKSSLEF